jgi:hypothetical protein
LFADDVNFLVGWSSSLAALVDPGVRDSDDEEGDDPDERKPQRVHDMMIACNEELSDSEDESDGRRDQQSHKVVPPPPN